MAQFLEINPGYSYIVDTGDNFYEQGVWSADSPRFDDTWRDVYWLEGFPVLASLDWFITVGNHDYGILDPRELYQVSLYVSLSSGLSQQSL